MKSREKKSRAGSNLFFTIMLSLAALILVLTAVVKRNSLMAIEELQPTYEEMIENQEGEFMISPSNLKVIHFLLDNAHIENLAVFSINSVPERISYEDALELYGEHIEEILDPSEIYYFIQTLYFDLSSGEAIILENDIISPKTGRIFVKDTNFVLDDETYTRTDYYGDSYHIKSEVGNCADILTTVGEDIFGSAPIISDAVQEFMKIYQGSVEPPSREEWLQFYREYLSNLNSNSKINYLASTQRIVNLTTLGNIEKTFYMEEQDCRKKVVSIDEIEKYYDAPLGTSAVGCNEFLVVKKLYKDTSSDSVLETTAVYAFAGMKPLGFCYKLYYDGTNYMNCGIIEKGKFESANYNGDGSTIGIIKASDILGFYSVPKNVIHDFIRTCKPTDPKTLLARWLAFKAAYEAKSATSLRKNFDGKAYAYTCF